MENATYTTITRQSGLMAEMRSIANNIANASTTGYRAEGVVFAEHVARLDRDNASLSMATASVRTTLQSQGALSRTGGTFDLAIEGDGYFTLDTPDGLRLTRAGHFGPNENGDLVNPDGHRLLDAGGAPVFVPQGTGAVGIAADGTISADGRPIGQIGLVRPTDPLAVTRGAGTVFDPGGGVEPAPDARMIQGFLEDSNVNPILQIGRMIEVQRAYDLGQSFLSQEDERIRGVIQTLQK